MAANGTTTTRGRRDTDEQLALLIAAGLPVSTAAQRAHVSLRTARRRLTEAAFTARVEHYRTRLVAETLAKLEGAMIGAADALRDLVAHDDPHVRCRAAVEVLKNALRVRESHDLAERVRRLEELLTREKS
jgi:hypothetical protein